MPLPTPPATPSRRLLPSCQPQPSLLPVVLAVLAVLGVGCSSPSPDATAGTGERPNVLFIAIDDLNDWVGALEGHPHAITPNIDALAQAGTNFLSAHTQAPICGPSRASLMSGLRPSTTGIYGQVEDSVLRAAHPMLYDAAFLPEYFAQHGYHTMGVGKLFHRHAPPNAFHDSGGREPGFGPKPPQRRYWDQPETSTDWGPFPDADNEMPDYRSASWAIDRLQGHATSGNGEKPFFLAVGFLRPHVPWHVPPSWFDMHPVEDIETPAYDANDFDDIPAIAREVAEVWQMPTTDWAIAQGYWPAIVQSYLASVTFVDAQVGRVLDALAGSPFADNTIVVLFSDHGYHIGEKGRFAKHSLWEPATRVPLIFSGPDIGRGQRTGAAVELLDIYPTLVDLAGLPPNGVVEGNSLRPLLENPDADWPHAAITTYGRNNHGIRKGMMRFIRYEDGTQELYDLANDPDEHTNLAVAVGARAAAGSEAGAGAGAGAGAAAGADVADKLDMMSALLPEVNVLWSPYSDIDTYDYFRDQKIAQSRLE